MTAAKAIMLVLKNKKIRGLIIGIIVGILMILLLFSCQADIFTTQNSTALASAAENEYEFWQKTSPQAAGYSCQGQKYCSYFNFGIDDWCCFFVGYCIDNADLDKSDCGYSSNVHTWVSNLKSLNKLEDSGNYTPNVGNLIFFDYSGRNHYRNGGNPTHIGIVTCVNGDNLTVIAGNEYNGATSNWSSVSYVNKYTISIDSNNIACYGAVGDEDSTTFSLTLSGSTELCSLTRNIICHNEIGVLYDDIETSQYGSVVANDNGAISVGVYGWHGNNAIKLLQTAYSLNSNQIANTCKSYGSAGEKVLSDIKTTANWSNYIPNSSVCSCVKAVLLTDAGKRAQNQTSLLDVNKYIKICTENGLTKNKCIAYCSDILNQWGINSFMANVYGQGKHGVLHGVNNSMSLKQIYKSKVGWGSKNQYMARRSWTYNYLNNL